MALIRRPTCTTCWRESPLTRSIVSTSCCPGIGVRAADDAHAPKRGALRRKPSLDRHLSSLICQLMSKLLARETQIVGAVRRTLTIEILFSPFSFGQYAGDGG